MNREQIIEMAEQAGIVVIGEAVWRLCELVAQAERETCAKVAESMRPHGGRMFDEAQSACFSALTDCAAAIRARWQA